MNKVFAIADSIHDFTKSTRRGQTDVLKKYCKQVLQAEMQSLDAGALALLERPDIEHAFRRSFYGDNKRDIPVDALLDQQVPVTDIFNVVESGGGRVDVVVPRDRKDIIMSLLESIDSKILYTCDVTLLKQDILCAVNRRILLETIATEYDRNRISKADNCVEVRKAVFKNAIPRENFLSLTEVNFDTDRILWQNSVGQEGAILMSRLITKQDFSNLPLFSKTISTTILEKVLPNAFDKIIQSKYGLVYGGNDAAYVKTLFDFKRLGDLGQMSMAQRFGTVFVSNDLMACMMSSVLFKNATLHTSKKPALDIYAPTEAENEDEDDLSSNRGYTFYNSFGSANKEAFAQQVTQRRNAFLEKRFQEYLTLYNFYVMLGNAVFQERIMFDKMVPKIIDTHGYITRVISAIRTKHSGAPLKQLLKATEYEFIPAQASVKKTRGAEMEIPTEYYFLTELVQLELARLILEYLLSVYAILENVKRLPQPMFQGADIEQNIQLLERLCDEARVPKLNTFLQPTPDILGNLKYLEKVYESIDAFVRVPKTPGVYKPFKFMRLPGVKQPMLSNVMELVTAYNTAANIHKFKRGGGTVQVGEYILYCAILTPEENTLDTLFQLVNKFQRFLKANRYETQAPSKRQRRFGGSRLRVTKVEEPSPASAPTKLVFTPTYRFKKYPLHYAPDLSDMAFNNLKTYPLLLFQYLFLKDFQLDVIGVGRVAAGVTGVTGVKGLTV
jgi:hypothetical protein